MKSNLYEQQTGRSEDKQFYMIFTTVHILARG